MKKKLKRYVKEIALSVAVIYAFDVIFLCVTHTKPVIPLWKNIVAITMGLIISRVIMSIVESNKK